MKKKKSDNSVYWKMAAVILPMALSGWIVLYISFKILVVTGPWSAPLIVIYIAILLAAGMYIPMKRAKVTYHAQVGDELFYIAYPAELKAALQMAEEKGIPEEKKQILEYYRQNTAPVREEETPEAYRRRQRRKTLYNLSGVVMAAPVPLLIYRGLPSLKDLLPLTFRSDLTGVFSLLGAVLLLLCAVLFYLRREIPGLAGAALIVLLLNAWACFVMFGLSRKYTLGEVFLCIGFFAVAAAGRFLIPRLAGDLRSPSQKSADKREFTLALYTLGVIDEIELNYRMSKGTKL